MSMSFALVTVTHSCTSFQFALDELRGQFSGTSLVIASVFIICLLVVPFLTATTYAATSVLFVTAFIPIDDMTIGSSIDGIIEFLLLAEENIVKFVSSVLVDRPALLWDFARWQRPVHVACRHRTLSHMVSWRDRQNTCLWPNVDIWSRDSSDPSFSRSLDSTYIACSQYCIKALNPLSIDVFCSSANF